MAITTSAPAQDHEFFLRHAFAVARRSRAQGNHLLGAILVGADGSILMEAENSCVVSGNRTGHAELNLIARASIAYDAQFLGQCSLYTSAEPCAMCAGAAYWTGTGRVVYGLSEKALGALIGAHPENLTMSLDRRQVLAAGQRTI
jgi:tRNA(Arg) A34 adenosine deaminase TadA